MHVPFVDLKVQYAALKPEIDAAIQDVLNRTAFILGPEVTALETAFAEYLGAKYVVGVSNGTDALRLALEALGIGAGDEVLTVPNTYIATCEAISQAGAACRWTEIDGATYNLDPARLEAAITSHTRAIMPVHLYGQPADMAPIMEEARRRGLRVIEDACQAHGARYRSRRVGTFGDVGCFSFYPGKNLGGYGDGGAIATDDPALADKVRMLRNHGQKEKYIHQVEGYCNRLDNLQAAVLNVKLPHLDTWNAQRRAHAALYTELLAGVPGVATPYVMPDVEHVYHLYVVQVPHRDQIQAALKAAGVETGIHYPVPLHQQPAYARLGYQEGDFPISASSAPRLLSLPMFPELTTEQIHFVVDALKDALSHAG
jgi:dTDP-4-amino-4,6-dideoxygalactose transaminase